MKNGRQLVLTKCQSLCLMTFAYLADVFIFKNKKGL